MALSKIQPLYTPKQIEKDIKKRKSLEKELKSRGWKYDEKSIGRWTHKCGELFGYDDMSFHITDTNVWLPTGTLEQTVKSNNLKQAEKRWTK